MSREYMFDDPSNMIDLAREIQSNVYWGGHFYLSEDQVEWKAFWDVVSVAVSVREAIGVEINSNSEVKFIYR